MHWHLQLQKHRTRRPFIAGILVAMFLSRNMVNVTSTFTVIPLFYSYVILFFV